MKKNIFKTLLISSSVLVFNAASAQQTTTTKTTAPQKQTTTATNPSSTKQTPTNDQSKVASKELGAQVNEWMKTNLGTNDVQGGRINVAATNLLTKVRDIRANVTDKDTRNFQIHQAMMQFDAQMKSVLTPEQSAKFQTMRNDLNASFKELKDETVTSSQE